MMRLSDWDWLGERTRPHFGQLTLWALLLCAQPLALYFLLYWQANKTSDLRSGPVTLLSFLPEAVLTSYLSLVVCYGLFVLATLLWASWLWLPGSAWLTALSF